MILAIDFDGTIVTDRFPSVGELRPGAKRCINLLHSEGYYIIIWTCRTQNKALEVAQFLQENGIHFDKINESSPMNVEKYSGIDTRKVYADLYVDDRGLIDIPSWQEIYTIVHNKLPTLADTGWP